MTREDLIDEVIALIQDNKRRLIKPLTFRQIFTNIITHSNNVDDDELLTRSETIANTTTWNGRFNKSYKIESEVTSALPTISNTSAAVGNTLEITKYNSTDYPLAGQEAKVNIQTGQFDPTKTHRIVVEYVSNDLVNLIIGQNSPAFVAPTFGLAPTFADTTAYEGDTITINGATGGTASSASYQWQGLSQLDVWEDIVGATTLSYTPPRSADVSTGFKNVRCIVTPLDSQNRQGTSITITIITFKKVENIQRSIGNFETGANINVRSNVTKTSDGTATKGTVNAADSNGWLASVVSPKYELGDFCRVYTKVRAREAGNNTGNTVQVKPGGSAAFDVSSRIISAVEDVAYTTDVRNHEVITLTNPASSDGTTHEFSIQSVLVGDFIEVEYCEIYKILN